jgi:hypothetical protein
MDPISTLLAAYISAITATGNQIPADINDNTINSEVITYADVNIPFQYQMWAINNESVCATYTEKMSVYAECTVKAKSLFTTLCNDLPEGNSENTKASLLKNMYCNASVNYGPTIALITKPKPLTSERAIEKQCNLLILKTMDNKDSELLAEKELICGMREE